MDHICHGEHRCGVQLRLGVLAGIVLGKGDGEFGTDLEFSPLLNL